WLRLICSPVVLGSVKSGAFSPTSNDRATPVTISRLVSVVLTMIRRATPGGRPRMGFSLSPRDATRIPPVRPGPPPGSADDAIRPIQHLRRDRVAERLSDLQVDDEFEPRIDFDRDRGGSGAFADLLYQSCRLPA